MQYSFQDYENLYLVMDLLTGGDLRFHVSRNKKFSEEQTSNKYDTLSFTFFSNCIILGLIT
jgi:serine/threonine protein kinase